MNLYARLALRAAFARLVIVGLCSTPFWGQAAAPSIIQVKLDSGKVTLHISRPVSLQAALDEFCKSTRTTCDGTAIAADATVGPLNFSGTWTEAVTKLMAGSRLNYVAGEPTSKNQGKLLLEPAGTYTPSAAAMPAPTNTMTNSPATAESTPAMESQPEAAQHAGPEAGESAAGSGSVMPFPDSQGRPMPTTGAQPQVLPFPDSNGKPIPVTTAQPDSLPFPDANGKAIPAKSAPSGNPFPVEIIRQGSGNH